jgi:transcriptional regulator with XRE-family HTH domain
MSVSAIPARVGVRIDPTKLDFELARRGLTSRRLAEVAGVHEVTISRARHGGALSERNLQKLAKALLEIPLMLGADLLIAEPEKKIAAGSTAAASKEASASGHPAPAV